MNYRIRSLTSRLTEIRMYVIPNCFTNTYLIKSSKANYIIDSGFGSQSARIVNNLMDGFNQTFVINTHYHWDHIWGNAFFPNALIVSHYNCKNNIQVHWDEMMDKYKKYKQGDVINCLPQLLFDTNIEINDELTLFHTPGHSNDGISIYDKIDKTMFVGDNIGDIDVSVVPILECRKDVFNKSLNTYSMFNANMFLSGHNDPQNIDIVDLIKGKLY